MKVPLIVFLTLFFMSSACSESDARIYPVDDKDIFEKDDTDSKLPVHDENNGETGEVFDETPVEDLDADNDFPDMVSVDEDGVVSPDEDNDDSNDVEYSDDFEDKGDDDIGLDDDPVTPLCFDKVCSSHEECDAEEGECISFDVSETYGCGPDLLEDLGYRGEGRCLKINCGKDSDCREDLGQICFHFSIPSDDFLNAESACARSLAGLPCSEEGRKLCQHDRNIALRCEDGVWRAYLCSITSYCEAGDCKPILYPAKMVISVDDLLVDLCINGVSLSPLGPNKGAWTHADEYHFNLVPGKNVIGVHGRDTGYVVSAIMATIEIFDEIYVTDGVMPPDDDVEYTPSDPEWDATLWRYFPAPEGTPREDWCDRHFDDSDWGPAIRAGTATTPIDEWGHLGAHPWINTSCGFSRCPGEFLPYYEDDIEGNEPMWIWDYKPVELNDAWFRFVIYLP